ncbi:MAG: PAS domain-containing protein [Methanoregulaceae archaeon]|jgi:two-component system phosphate regulon sensor histidine kinase PhoR|nr:PAS domain-containing protein [Methanoregulaceae archaeon]
MSEPNELPESDELLKQLEDAKNRIQELETRLSSESRQHARAEGQLEVTPINEADVTLRRLVQRIAMILQAEKIAIMFYDRERGELIGIPPAYGIEEDRLSLFRVRATQGVSGQVFRDSEPLIFHDATNDPRTQKDPFSLLHVSNGITVPLVIEKRDEENRVIERTTIGVLHAFNKRHGEDFNDEDVRLLERMARNVGSIIANLQLYREVVEEREELLQTFESLAAGLMLVSPEGRISQINASARAIFGIDAEALGKNYLDVIRDDNRDQLREVLQSAMRGDENISQDIIVNIANVERHYQVQAAQVRSDEGKDLGVVAIFIDVTDIRMIDKMKSSFVAMASHELRTPLTAIKGFVSTLLMDDGFSNEERREFYMIIDQECDRLTRLINDLLNTSRIEAGESLKPNYTRVDAKALLEKVVLIQRQSTHKHQIKLDIRSEIPKIIGDEDKLDQILTNLLNNAIKYSPNGGDITVHAVVEDDHLLVGVEDQGLGIPKDHQAKVFDKFHRVNNEDNRRIYGTGLGLYLVKHLVESVHMGKIWVESEVGKGSTFLFRIPIEIDIENAKAINH